MKPGQHEGKKVPSVVPSSAESGAIRLASRTTDPAPTCTPIAQSGAWDATKSRPRKPAVRGELCADRRQYASVCIVDETQTTKVRPTGFEPVTLGSEDRRSKPGGFARFRNFLRHQIRRAEIQH